MNENIYKIPDRAEWVDLYANKLYAYAFSRLRDHAAAEDMVQDTFLVALEKTGTFRGESTFETWLIAILRRKIVDHFRKIAKECSTSLNELNEMTESSFFTEKGKWLSEERPAHWSSSPMNELEQKELRRIISDCQSKLKTLQQTIFTLKYTEDISSEDICKELEISASNYWVILHRVRLQMRKCIEKNWFVK